MELSRRGVIGGLGVVGLGAVGFAGAVAVDDDGDGATTEASDGDGPGGDGAGSDGSGEDAEGSDATSVAVDPDAPFEARLLYEDGSDDGSSGDGSGDDGESGDRLFDAAGLEYVQGVREEDGEHLVYVALSEAGRESFRDRLETSGAIDDPGPFAVSMTLGGEEVRHVDLDEPTVTALSDEEWSGVLTLPFESAGTAESVYGSLSAE
ncbi:hypothetical protein DQW50_15335 [Halorubrum sp. 48-1-W]|uniref:hypothetical protein n=1 Tax=Halorubrum sp. 48-1-W TaxID=2249761 RepID=UPI000DCEDA8E|nr:hypothetical protein [Halorubrum sp. 48-1-W]RAW44212.1 hypothetical protein DQW50_15335 [Halorubrum sp. 48-1-W]